MMDNKYDNENVHIFRNLRMLQWWIFMILFMCVCVPGLIFQRVVSRDEGQRVQRRQSSYKLSLRFSSRRGRWHQSVGRPSLHSLSSHLLVVSLLDLYTLSYLIHFRQFWVLLWSQKLFNTTCVHVLRHR